MTSSSSTKTIAADQSPMKRGATLIGTIAWAGIAAWLTFAIVNLFWSDDYIYELLTDRGKFQHVNVFLMWFAVALLIKTAFQCWSESRAETDADNIMKPVIAKWQSEVDSQSSSTADRKKRDQGKDVLSQMVKSGVAAGDPVAPRLKPGKRRMLLQRVHRVALYLQSTRAQNLQGVMDVNRDLSALDADRLSGQFALVRYIVYLMPVIGFVGTVWGIGSALGGISEALPSVTDLEGFTSKLGVATSSLQVAFDTTFLALVLSRLLTLLLTLGSSQSENVLAFVDTWVIDNVLRHVTEHNPMEETLQGGFAAMIGKTDSGLYKEGLAGIKTAIDDTKGHVENLANKSAQTIAMKLSEARDSCDEIRTAQAKGHEHVKKLADAVGGLSGDVAKLVESAGDNAEKTRTAAQAVAKTIDELRENCRDIHAAQAEGQKEVKKLADGVGNLPGFGQNLQQAADELKNASDKLASLAGTMANVGEMAEHVKTGADSLSSIKSSTSRMQTSLTKELDGGDGKPQSIDMISAIIQMRDALATQLAESAETSARQIEEALDSVSEANKMVGENLGILSQRFLELRQSILKAMKG